jgi:hypothetical protein
MKKTTIALSKSKRTERLQVHLQPEELAAIHDFQYSNRLPTRAAAVRELLRRGLASIEREH